MREGIFRVLEHQITAVKNVEPRELDTDQEEEIEKETVKEEYI